MTKLAQKFANESQFLSREDRAELVEKLLLSLNIPIQTDIDRIWADEAERRVIEYNEGKIESIDGEKVIKEIRDRLNK